MKIPTLNASRNAFIQQLPKNQKIDKDEEEAQF
jgi:hypothetical protein